MSQIVQWIQDEKKRQIETLQLIASENFAADEVLAAQGSVLTNKYAEGYPGRRYYAGCETVDKIELSAIASAKKLFGAGYANVQPHSGSQANAAVYLALLKPGDTILAMSLNAGGHLTHGHAVNMSGVYYNCVGYGLADDHSIDYDEIEALAMKHRPRLMIGGYSAYTKDIEWVRLRQIADKVGAYLLADVAHIAGLIAVGLMNSPLPHAHVVTSTTHKTLRGPRSGLILAGDDPKIHKALNRGVFPGTQGGPLMHVIAAKAIAFDAALQPSFKCYQERVLANAKVLAAECMGYGMKLIGHGTENHQVILDLRGDELSGDDYEKMCENVGIIVNKNCVFNDPRPPTKTSGIRMGTPALTTRGFQEADMSKVAYWLSQVIQHKNQSAELRNEIQEFCRAFPLYSE